MAKYKVTFTLLGKTASIETEAETPYGADYNLRQWLLKRLSVESIENIEDPPNKQEKTSFKGDGEALDMLNKIFGK